MSYLYHVQGLWRDGTVSRGYTVELPCDNDAIAAGQSMLEDLTFDVDVVRVITDDGELVWDSRDSVNQ